MLLAPSNSLPPMHSSTAPSLKSMGAFVSDGQSMDRLRAARQCRSVRPSADLSWRHDFFQGDEDFGAALRRVACRAWRDKGRCGRVANAEAARDLCVAIGLPEA